MVQIMKKNDILLKASNLKRSKTKPTLLVETSLVDTETGMEVESRSTTLHDFHWTISRSKENTTIDITCDLWLEFCVRLDCYNLMKNPPVSRDNGATITNFKLVGSRCTYSGTFVDWKLISFSDNAGIVRFTVDNYNFRTTKNTI